MQILHKYVFSLYVYMYFNEVEPRYKAHFMLHFSFCWRGHVVVKGPRYERPKANV